MASPKKQVSKKSKPKNEPPVAESVTAKGKPGAEAAAAFAFGRENYRLLVIGLVVILVGFLLMIGGGSDDPNVFSDDIFSFRRMTLAPILVLAGYIIEIYAIMKKPKD
jgi:hypothetical protein